VSSDGGINFGLILKAGDFDPTKGPVDKPQLQVKNAGRYNGYIFRVQLINTCGSVNSTDSLLCSIAAPGFLAISPVSPYLVLTGQSGQITASASGAASVSWSYSPTGAGGTFSTLLPPAYTVSGDAVSSVVSFT
jgi:hypothetical protein